MYDDFRMERMVYTGTYQGKYYVNGYLLTGTDQDRYYRNGILFTGRYNGSDYVNGVKVKNTTGQGQNQSTPTYTSNNKPIPIIMAETPRIDSTKMTNDTKNLIQKAAAAQNISVKMMEEMLYSMIVQGANGLDFPKFVNQAHLEARIRELCDKIIEEKEASKSWWDKTVDWIVKTAQDIGNIVWENRSAILTGLAILATAVGAGFLVAAIAGLTGVAIGITATTAMTYCTYALSASMISSLTLQLKAESGADFYSIDGWIAMANLVISLGSIVTQALIQISVMNGTYGGTPPQNLTVQSGSYDDLSQNAKDSYDAYDKNGWKGNTSGQTTGTKAGAAYSNSDGALPTTDSSGNAITYKEFDVNNKVQGMARDGERFLIGSDGSIYYTDSHYGQGASLSGILPFMKIK